MKRKPVFAILSMLIVQVVFAQVSTSIAEFDQIAIRLDNVAFEEASYMSVLNQDNEVIAYYDRFENQSGPVKSMRMFDFEKNLVYVLVPLITDNGFQIHIRDSEKSRGLVNLTANIDGLRINYHSEVDYFGKPYSFNFFSRYGFGKASIKETVQYEGQDVVSYQTKVTAFSGIKTAPIMADKTFYLENKIDVANWVLIIQLLKELSLEASRYNSLRNPGQ